MGYETRANQIMELLQKAGNMEVSKISGLLQVSAVTVRKDLQRMEQEGRLRRTHGGAALPGGQADARLEAMERIAACAAGEIQSGDCVIMNAGNTTLLTARKLLGRRDLTIITNSISIARELAHQPAMRLIFLGGEVNADGNFTYGWDAVTQLEQYKANKLILSASGFSCSAGLTTRHMEAADLMRKMIARTERVIAVADDTKIGFESFYQVGSLDAVDMLITNPTEETAQELQNLRQMGILVRNC